MTSVDVGTSSTTSGCATPWHDDNFLLFVDVTSSNGCALNETSQWALCLFWLILHIAILLDFIVARYVRQADKSPVVVTVLIVAGLVVTIMMLALVVADPTVTVLTRPVSGPFLLVFFALRTLPVMAVPLAILYLVTVSLEVLALELQRHDHDFPDPQTWRRSWFDVPTRLATSTWRQHLLQIARTAALTLAAALALCWLLTLIILPNVAPMAEHRHQQEQLLRSAWIAACIFSALQLVVLVPVILHLRTIVTRILGREMHAEKDAVAPAIMMMAEPTLPKPVIVDSEAAQRELIHSRLQMLQRRLRRNTIFLACACVSSCVIFAIASALGMRWWLFHVQMAQSLAVFISAVSFFRVRLWVQQLGRPCLWLWRYDDPDGSAEVERHRSNTNFAEAVNMELHRDRPKSKRFTTSSSGSPSPAGTPPLQTADEGMRSRSSSRSAEIVTASANVPALDSAEADVVKVVSLDQATLEELIQAEMTANAKAEAIAAEHYQAVQEQHHRSISSASTASSVSVFDIAPLGLSRIDLLEAISELDEANGAQNSDEQQCQEQRDSDEVDR